MVYVRSLGHPTRVYGMGMWELSCSYGEHSGQPACSSCYPCARLSWPLRIDEMTLRLV